MTAETIIKLTEFINEHNVPEDDVEEIAELLDIRVCSVCGDLMYEGYVIDNGSGWYCTDECMNADGMTREEFEELFDDGNGDSYWTEWI